MKDPRYAEIAWLLVIAVLVAGGGLNLLHVLAVYRGLGSALLALAIAGTVVMIRRAYVPESPTVRADVTKAIAYCVSAILAFIAVAARQHWAIGACLAAVEVALIFDIMTIVARPRAVGG